MMDPYAQPTSDLSTVLHTHRPPYSSNVGLRHFHLTVSTIVCTNNLQHAYNNTAPVSLFTARKCVLTAVFTPTGERIPETYPRKPMAFLQVPLQLNIRS